MLMPESNAGITNGEPIYFRVAFKPPATIGQAQNSMSNHPITNHTLPPFPPPKKHIQLTPQTPHLAVDFTGKQGILEAKGRHDPCVVPRAVAIVEAMAALTLMDQLMEQGSRERMRAMLPGAR